MPVANQTELLLVLERGQFDTVLGTPEADYLDFKEAPYQLDLPRQKWELAKDVAALANSRGGVILFGYRTNRPANALVDLAVEHRPIPKELVNWDAYRQTISSWIYPSIDGLEVAWFPAATTVDRGVFALVVPPQPEAAKYFVVREIDRPDGTFPGAFGVPVRQGDVVAWVRPEVLHDLLREALGLRRRGPVVATGLDHAARLQDQNRRVDERCRRIEALAGWADVPFVVFHALSNDPLDRPDDFYGNGGFVAKLERPDVLRPRGFHIQTGVPVEVQPDGALATASSRRVLWLSQDGFFSAGVRADPEFLGWYVNQGDRRPTALNPRVLTEYTLEFGRFVHTHLRPLALGPWSLWISIVGFDRAGGVLLVPALGADGEALFWRGMHPEQRAALEPCGHRRVESGASAGADAHRLLVEFYALFGFPPDEIPFVEHGVVSERLLLEGMR